jgi:hypothetical protein
MVFTLFLFMVAHDISSFNKVLLAFARYDDSYNLDNVEPIDQGG